jgi:hypothetical protein
VTQFLQVPAQLGEAALQQAVTVLVKSLGWVQDNVFVESVE